MTRSASLSTERLLNGALFIGCVYEIIALVSPLPTITRILKTLGKKHPLGKATLWLWCGFVAWHFLEPDDVN